MSARPRIGLGAWSYRLKVPLLITLVSVVTALAISIAIAVLARQWLREDLHDHAAAVAQSLARGLVVHIARDDVWEAFEAVRAVAAVDGGQQWTDVVVLDRNGKVFVSSDPLRFSIGAPGATLAEPMKRASELRAKPGETVVEELHTVQNSFSVVSVPLLSGDRELLGTLLMSYSHAIFAERYRDTVATLAGLTATLVVLLMPLGWWLGHRLANPVTRVTDALYKLGEDAAMKSSAYAAATAGPPDDGPAPESELDRLEHALARLQQQLHEKEQLQQQFIAADRLAAIGRMTSGVAHEINNPLAGMLNALSNLRKEPALLQKTVALVERGLEQIRQTLSALLIETKTAHRPLSPSDIDDLQVLMRPQALQKHLYLDWSYPFTSDLAVPAALVRQVVLNLLLNAANASESRIAFSASATDAALTLRVENDGKEFPSALRQRPFEPVIGGDGHGLGLWASHQLVTSMGGRMTLATQAGKTVFEVHIPFEPVLVAGMRSTEIHEMAL